VGSLWAIREQTGAPIAVHHADNHLLRTGTIVVPPAITAWGRVLFLILRCFSFLGRFEPVEPEITIEDRFALDEFGVSGCVISTPGHTAGSVSVVLKSGEALVGDLAVNVLPFEIGLGIPAVGESRQEIRMSWKKLIAAGATRIYPAHGRPFCGHRLTT
jgi:glyoxylase-like metal-dependent hydrolase (beta-lactamase superfamily II)